MAATAVATTLAWTGAPLFALWVGSQTQGDVAPTMESIAVVVLVLAVTEFVLVLLLSNLSKTYDRVSGRAIPARRPPPWYSSMRGERDVDVIRHYGTSAAERVVAVCCAGALLTFEIWFFFLSGSSLPAP
jgi:hypothetical protein